MSKQSIIDNLNEQQIDIVTAPIQDMLIQAGAGTGKTRVLVSRIAYLLDIEQIKPWNILAVTFTNKAAKEMKQRVESLVEDHEVSRLEVSTIHSFCVKVLRRFHNDAHLPQNFSILTDSDQYALLKNFFVDREMSAQWIKDQFAGQDLHDFINLFKKLSPKKYDEIMEQGPILVKKISVEKIKSMTDIEFIECLHFLYSYLCQVNGLVDFDSLLIKTRDLLKKNPQILKILSDRYQHIFIDEVQDCDENQADIFAMLKQNPSVTICLIGDEDQAIYSWRGGSAYAFEKYPFFKNLVVKDLTINYRSNQNILNVANAIISKSAIRRKSSRLVCPIAWKLESEALAKAQAEQKNSQNGEAVKKKIMVCDPRSPKVIFACPKDSLHSESYGDYVVDLVEKFHYKYNLPYKDIAVLYRNNSLSLYPEQALTAKGISYQIFGGMKFYERAEILDVLACLRLILNDKDNSAFDRAISSQKRGVGRVTLKKLENYATNLNLSLYQAIKHCVESHDQANLKIFKKIVLFFEMIERFKGLVKTLDLPKLVYTIVMDSGLYAVYDKVDRKERASHKGNSHCENLRQFILNAHTFIKKLQIATLFDDINQDEEASIETVEATKIKGQALLDLNLSEKSQKIAAEAEKNVEQSYHFTSEQRTEIFYNFVCSSTLISSAEANTQGDLGIDYDAVNLLTVHASKGLEFKAVILIGFNEGILPSLRGDEEEERRIAYVAVTRAQQYLCVLYCQSGCDYRGYVEYLPPSSFVTDVKNRHRHYKRIPFKEYVDCEISDLSFD